MGLTLCLENPISTSHGRYKLTDNSFKLMNKIRRLLTKPVLFSIGLHLFILIFLFMRFSHPENVQMNKSKEVNIVHAVAVNESQINQKPNVQPVKTIPLITQRTISQIEQTALKQTPVPVTKQEVIKPTQVKQEVIIKKSEPIKLQEPSLKESPVVVAQEKPVVAEKRKQEKKRPNKQVSKIRREHKANELQKELASEVASKSVNKAVSAEEEDEIAPVADEGEESPSDAKATENQKSTNASKSASDDGAEIDKYKQGIIRSISQKWIMPDMEDKNLACQLLVHLAPGGVVISVDVIKESGNPNLDRSATNAIMKASPLPVPENAELFDNFRSLRLTFRPQGIVSG